MTTSTSTARVASALARIPLDQAWLGTIDRLAAALAIEHGFIYGQDHRAHLLRTLTRWPNGGVELGFLDTLVRATLGIEVDAAEAVDAFRVPEWTPLGVPMGRLAATTVLDTGALREAMTPHGTC
ncbi:hypothetical protein NCCP1664_22210 [Zafaria cholistanensis]|uniref:Uncharacterized protein n=1 Tax=Zafaria cholistanensis TaxID=1682741 RepID=A0A5A7NT13_9MICC|nr:hypothetical protein [Zafaria cholistanensis]GER23726.1 hypothetical protein NCCP1664_22210 [Zafaria cholistanensis]